MRPPSRMNTFVPCHSSTPKSASKLSVTVNHGISQSIRAFSRAMSCLRRSAGEDERGVASVQMRDMRDLVGHHRAAHAGVLGPAAHARLVEGAVDDQLAAAVEQVGEARLAIRPLEHIVLLHGHPRHPPTLGRQRVTCAGVFLLLHEHPLARRLPFPGRYDRRLLHREPLAYDLMLLHG